MTNLLLGLGLMVAVFVGPIEGACDVRGANLSAPANAKIVTDLRASPRAPKNVIVFDPTPNIDMFFAAFDGSDIGYRNATNNRPKALIWADVACLGYNGGCSIRVGKIARHYPIKNPKACPRIASSGGSHSTIFPFNAKVMADNIFARLVVDMLPHYFGIRNDIRSYLPLADISRNINGGVRSLGGPERRLSSATGFTKGAPQENNRPDANARCDNPERRHDPLCKRILRRNEGAPIEYGLLRLMLFGGLVVAFGIAGGKLSLWGFDRRNELVFYGGIAGTAFLSLFSGLLIFTYPLWLSFLP